MMAAPIFKEGMRRTSKQKALNANIMAARILSEAMKTSLGPKGMDKMFLTSVGDVFVTNDGATILEKMDVTNPIAKMLVEVAKTQDEMTGDGTTTSVVLAGELLKEAKDLMDKNIHPSIIMGGYEIATKRSLEFMKDFAFKIDPSDEAALKKVIKVALSSKFLIENVDFITDIVADAILRIFNKKITSDGSILDDIKVQKKHGESLIDSKIVEGIVIDKVDKEVVLHSKMPRKIKDAKIALIVKPLEIKKLEFTSKLTIDSPGKMKAFSIEEENLLKNKINKLTEMGVNVLICQREISDKAIQMLASKNILAIKRVKFVEMDRLVKATGGKLVSDIEELKYEDLGHAGFVEERKFGEDKQALSRRDILLFVEKCKNPKALTILVRGGTKIIVDEAERVIHDALSVANDIIKDPYVVVGGGAAELETSRRLKSFAEKSKGKEQLAILAFAKALESIPTALAENSGLNSIDILTELRAKHEEGGIWYGVDPFEDSVKDLYEKGIFEPLNVKTQAIISASEASQMIMKIDDVIFSSDSGTQKKEKNEEEE